MGAVVAVADGYDNAFPAIRNALTSVKQFDSFTSLSISPYMRH